MYPNVRHMTSSCTLSVSYIEQTIIILLSVSYTYFTDKKDNYARNNKKYINK